MNRTIAIGDIHGCSSALAALVSVIGLKADDTIVPLGDYVDRGIDSKGVLDLLIDLKGRCKLRPILGNHDQMMLQSRDGQSEFRLWMDCGGISALDSYGDSAQLDLIPPQHIAFLESCLSYFETESHIFLHANYRPNLPLSENDDHTIRWLSLRDYMPKKLHCSGKKAIVGHSPQSEVLDTVPITCIDTGVCNGGWLTAMDVVSGRVWQVNERGEERK